MSEAGKPDREFDIVLYGATGFAGKLTAQYLAAAGGGARIALAGRSTDRLLGVRDSLGEAARSWPLIAADASQPSTLNAHSAPINGQMEYLSAFAWACTRESPRQYPKVMSGSTCIWHHGSATWDMVGKYFFPRLLANASCESFPTMSRYSTWVSTG